MKNLAIAAAVIMLLSTSAHTQTTELTLTCNGKSTFGTKETQSINNMGLVLNLTEKTVTGFVGIVATIYKSDTTTIFFQGKETFPLETVVAGSMDRITGSVSVIINYMGDDDTPSSTASLELTCAPTPTKRLF
jgi:hypothetical protein